MTTYCTFHLASFLFGVDVARVQEIIRSPDVVPVPLAPPAVTGLINLRGQLVTVIDLRGRLDMPPGEVPGRMQIVLRSSKDVRSLAVDRMGDMLDVDDSVLRRPPDALTGVARELTLGAHDLTDRLLLILDVDKTAFL